MAVSGVIEHIELDKGLDMVNKEGVGGKKWISQKWLSNETNKLILKCASFYKMGWSLIRLENSNIVHKSQMLSDVHTAWSILRPLDYDSVRPPPGWYARANIGVKWDHESTTLSVKHTKMYLFSSSSRNLHIISKAKPKWSFCWQISEFGCSYHPCKHGDARRQACCHHRTGIRLYNLRPSNR